MARPPFSRARLEALLEAVPRHPAPEADLEQYRTPAGIAAEFLLGAWEEGDLEGKKVLDLGCGTGILSIGAALLGSRVTGLDIDKASLVVARDAAAAAGVVAKWIGADVAAWRPEPFDTVLMNPPFGAQAANRRNDRVFLRAALDAAPVLHLLSPTRSERFLQAFLRDHGATVERTGLWNYPLERQFAFHRLEARIVKVGAYRAHRRG